MDDLRKQSDKELKKIEDEIERIYKDAEGDLREKWTAYMDRAEKRVASYGKAYSDAVKSGDADAIAAAKAALNKKIESVTIRDKQFADMVDAVTDRMANVNQLAADYVNGQMPRMYSYNYNGSLREVQKDADAAGISGIAFNMIDDATVERMQKRGEVTLPKRKIDVPKDKQWNRKAINAQIMQGIIQGESIPQMSKRLREVTDMNKNSSIRNARTLTTEAENGGRLDSMKTASDLGLEYEKTWIATHDERTRLSHALIDGESVPLDETFSNGLQFPADPSGPPEEVYNCRCSLVRKLIGYKGHAIDDIGSYEPTYFADAQQAAAENPPTETELNETAEAFTEEQATETAAAAEESARDFTEKETELFEWYVSGEGMYINNALRGISDVKLTDEEKQKVKTLDEAIAKNVVENKELYRSVDASAVFGNMSQTQYEELRSALIYGAETNEQKQMLARAEKTVGKEIVDEGFLSTTTDKDLALNWGDFTGSEKPITIVYDVGEGVHGADLGFLDVKGDEQNEVLLERGLPYTVTSYGIEPVFDENGEQVGKEIVVHAKIGNEEAEHAEAGLPEKVTENFDAFADKYATAKFEHTMTCDENGNIMYQGGGRKTSVSTPRSIANQSEGCYQIHNHPEDVVFSAGDIAYMEEFGLKAETVVTSGKREFTLINNDTTPKKEGERHFSAAAKEALDKFEKESTDGRRELMARLNETDMTREEKAKEIRRYMSENLATEKMIDWYKENAEEYGFEFIEKKVK